MILLLIPLPADITLPLRHATWPLDIDAIDTPYAIIDIDIIAITPLLLILFITPHYCIITLAIDALILHYVIDNDITPLIIDYASLRHIIDTPLIFAITLFAIDYAIDYMPYYFYA
jgi:hypothetical protein